MDAPDAAQDFPVLSVSLLVVLTFGMYQFKQAASYTREHMVRASTPLTSIIDIYHDADNIIRVRIQSIHISSKKFFHWVQYYLSDGEDAITACYCQCKTAMHIIGCYAHVVSVLWFLVILIINSFLSMK